MLQAVTEKMLMKKMLSIESFSKREHPLLTEAGENVFKLGDLEISVRKCMVTIKNNKKEYELWINRIQNLPIEYVVFDRRKEETEHCHFLKEELNLLKNNCAEIYQDLIKYEVPDDLIENVNNF